jgi:hypothetical protein
MQRLHIDDLSAPSTSISADTADPTWTLVVRRGDCPRGWISCWCPPPTPTAGNEAASTLINGNGGVVVLVSLVHGSQMTATGVFFGVASLPPSWAEVRLSKLVQSRGHLGSQPCRHWCSLAFVRCFSVRIGPARRAGQKRVTLNHLPTRGQRRDCLAAGKRVCAD